MKKLFLIAAMFSVATLAWTANDTPWKDKPYDQWDTKDVQKILSDSPWARTVRVDTNWKPAASAPAATSKGNNSNAAGMGNNAPNTPNNSSGNSSGSSGAGPGGAAASRGAAANSSGGGYGGGSSQGGDADSGSDEQQASTIFEVRWASSRIMREAFARAAEINNTLKPADAETILAKPVENYELVVVGPDMTPFVGLDEAALKNAATLTLKKSKRKLTPTSVSIQKNGDQVKDVLFDFQKKTDTGEPTIATDEKNATFECKVNKLSLKASFEVPKMADTKGSDL
jgi:hypothetical protein